MKTKYYLIFLVLLLSFCFHNKVSAQKCLLFKYDTGGNRISRTVTTNCNIVRETVNEPDNLIAEDDVKVYPNPNYGLFIVCMPDSVRKSNSTYKLYDIESQLITEGALGKYETEIDVGNKPAGVYLLKIINGEDVISKIVLKQ